jgi:hypothetical protein
MQGQIVLISPRGALAELDRGTLLKLMDPMHPMGRADLCALSLRAVVQPGVDGEVAAVISLDAETDAQIVAAIESSAREAGFHWRILPEADFAKALSDLAETPRTA